MCLEVIFFSLDVSMFVELHPSMYMVLDKVGVMVYTHPVSGLAVFYLVF